MSRFTRTCERKAAFMAARDRAVAELRATILTAVPIAPREAHAHAVTATLRPAPLWRLPRMPRLPEPAGLV
jgi:hypothetical protein